MRKALILLACIFLLRAGSSGPLPIPVYPDAGQIPTAPPPPMATHTSTRLPPSQPTDTATVPPNVRWASKTPSLAAAPASANPPTPTGTPTLTSTATMALTLTPRLTPTPFLNLRIVVYLDINQDSLFEYGEGVQDLLLLIKAGHWTDQAILQDGELWLALPDGLPPGSEVQVQSPYLHWSEVLRAPRDGEIAQAILQLELPRFPVSLP